MSSRTEGDRAGTQVHEGEPVTKIDIKNAMYEASSALDKDDLKRTNERVAYTLALVRKMIAQEAQSR